MNDNQYSVLVIFVFDSLFLLHLFCILCLLSRIDRDLAKEEREQERERGRPSVKEKISNYVAKIIVKQNTELNRTIYRMYNVYRCVARIVYRCSRIVLLLQMFVWNQYSPEYSNCVCAFPFFTSLLEFSFFFFSEIRFMEEQHTQTHHHFYDMLFFDLSFIFLCFFCRF